MGEINMTAKETPPIGRHSSRITACLANVLLAAATIVGAAPASAGPVTLIPGDLAVTYSVYPRLADPNTGSTGGYTTPNIVANVTPLPHNPPVTANADGT